KSVSADQVRGFEPVAGKYSPRLTIRLLNDDMQRHEQSFTADKELIPWYRNEMRDSSERRNGLSVGKK
ncbi:MAG TPA: hypothetical protein VK148_16955, partial [Xanthobacteraceae bacterium]|nr:hypothetical protein [Xanthobacteraceae bacterium]